MLLPFFTAPRDARVPVSMKAWLHPMEVMDKDVAGRKMTAGEYHDPVGRRLDEEFILRRD
jgi:uncharacterized protein with von Willebrand factor type A (vWA) domain